MNTDNGKTNKRKSSLYCGTSLCPEMVSIELCDRCASSCAGRRALNGAEPLSGREMYVRSFVRRYSTPGFTNRCAASSSITLADSEDLQNGAVSSVIYTRIRDPPHTSQPPESCSAMRANLPRHKYTNRAVFMRRRKAGRNALIYHVIL